MSGALNERTSARLRTTLQRAVLAAAIVALVLWVALSRINAVQHASIGLVAVAVALALARRTVGGRPTSSASSPYIYLRALADDTAYQYVIDLDELLAAGSVPSTWL
jgi:hypothetical protein